jgi:hypothetical protein
MKSTIQKTLLGGLSSLILGTGLVMAEDANEKKSDALKVEVLSGEANASILKILKEAGLDEKIQKQVEEALKNEIAGAEGAEKAKGEEGELVKIKTFVMGPDGKMKELDSDAEQNLNLDDLLRGAGVEGKRDKADKADKIDKEIMDLVVGKIVVVGEDGKRIEKEFGQGQDLNAIIQEALLGGDHGDIDLNEMIKKNVRVLGFGPAVIDDKADDSEIEVLKAELKEIREDAKAQRELLEKILKKLE